MSTDNGNGDLKLMDEYDFKTPINATIIIDDDEEESKPTVEKEQNSNKVNCNMEDIVSEIIKDIYKVTKKDNQGTSANISTTSALDNHKSVEIAETAKKDNTTFQTKSSSQVGEGDNQTITGNAQITNINQTAMNPQESNRLGCLQQLVHPTNQDDTSQKVNKCVEALLNTVSTHMIFIMKAFEEYKLINLKTSDARVLDTAWKQYCNTKFRFFYLSFSAVCNIMIPKENDRAFMDNFIDNTVKLAKIRHLHCEPTEMSLLCKDMFQWVKARTQNPVLTDLLHTPEYTAADKKTNQVAERNTSQEQQSCRPNNVDSTCFFRSGLPGRELTISVNQTVVNNSQSASHHCNQPYNFPSTQNMMSPAALRNNTTYYNTQEYQSYSSYKQIATHPYKSKSRPCRNQAASTASRKQVQQETFQNHNQQPPAPQTRPPPYYLPQTNQQSVPSTVINTQNYTETQHTNPVHSDCFQRDQEQLEVNRSLSRDSGFMSPLSSVSNEPTCSPRHEFDPSATPLITHVTSLNPSVAFIRDGACHVCGNLTKHKCLGCYKCYYCSHRCQIADWKYHYYICK